VGTILNFTGAAMRSKWHGPALFAIILLAGAGGVASAAAQASTPTAAAPAWKLVWSDEFNGPNGSAVDASKWVSETGGGGWGNNELEYYTNRLDNASQQDGNLVIKVLQEKYTGADGVTRSYTSARLKTLGKFSQTYGRFEARIKIPRGQGIWPAFWMLGDDIDKPGWPDCGEIDIMENIGKEPGLVHGTIHGWDIPASTASALHSLFLPLFLALFLVTPALPMTFTSSPSSGNRTRSASTSTITFMRPALPPIFPRERSGFTTIRSSSCSTLLWAAPGREIPTRLRSSRKPCWWIMCESTNGRIRPRPDRRNINSWVDECCADLSTVGAPQPADGNYFFFW